MKRLQNSFAFKLLQNSKRRLTALLVQTKEQTIYTADIINAWLTVKRETALLSVLLMIAQLMPMAVMPIVAQAQSVPYSTANVIVVNGINVPDKATWEVGVAKLRDKFFSSHPTLASTVTFTPFYNQSDGMWLDGIQSAQHAANAPNLKPYLDDIAKLSEPNQGIFALIGAGYYVSSYAEEVIKNRLTGSVATRPQDYRDLVDTIKKSLFTDKKRVVLVGHSQGNYYVNYAYKEIVADKTSQTTAGIILPNQNLLSVVNVANPANWSADGRYAYVTHCNDIINLVPQHLPSNIGSGANCTAQDILAGPITASNVADLVTTARSVIVYSDWASAWSNLISHPLNFVWTSLKVASLLVSLQRIGRLYFSVQQHSFENAYLANGSDTQKKIYQLLEDSLPEPGCGSDTNCYLKESFSGNDYTTNWQLTDYTGAGAKVYYGGNKMDLSVSQLTSDPIYGGGKLVLRTRRVFSGPFIANLSFKNITNIIAQYAAAGYGTSVISLKRASDNSSIISLTLTSDTGSDWHQMKIVRTDTQVSMTVDNQTWTGQSASVASSVPTDAYYIEVKAQGNGILSVSNLSVTRTAPVVTPPPTLTATCSASPNPVIAGKKTVFTGSSTGGTGTKTGVWGGVVSGNGTTATYIPPASAPAGFGKATYTVTDSGSPKQIVTANCQVQINAPTVPPSTASFNETFDNQYSSRWTYTPASGSPSVTWSAGDLKIRAPKSGASARFDSVQTFNGDLDVSFTFNHQGSGRTSVYLTSASGGQPLAGVDLDTDDCNYLNFSVPGKSTDWKYAGSPYMNRKVVIRMVTSASTVQFYVDGTLKETMSFSGTGPYRLMMVAGSVSWKSGDNITDFYGVTAQAGTITQAPTALVLSSVSVSPNPPTTGLVRITANGTGITSATAMELTGPYCTPCVLSVKVSQTATALVMDAQLNNPGTFTVKLRDGSQLTAGKDFAVTAAPTLTAFSETFQTNYSTNWNMTVGSGNPLTAWEPGRLRVQASKSGASASFISKQTLAGPLAVEFTFAHYNYGRTSVWILPASGDQRLASVDLDTNDCDYLNFSVPGKSTDWKYAGNPYMNRKVVIRMVTSASTVQFFVDGTLMETMPFSGTGPYRLAFAVGSVSWKSGDNITDFYGVTTTTGTSTTPTPTTGTVGIAVSGYNGTLGCNLNNVSITAPTILSSKPTGSYSLACTAPSGYTITGITPSPTQTLSAGATVSFTVGLKTTTVVPPPLSNVSCSVSSTSVQTGTPVTYTANWSGGSGSPGFNWTGHVSGTTRSVSKTFDSAGTYTASVVVMDNGQQLTGQCSNVTVTAPPPPPPSLSVSWFWYSPDSPKTTGTITLNFTGTGFNSTTQVWVFGLNCTNGCQAAVSVVATDGKTMKALAQLRNADNFQIKLRNGSSGNFVLAGTVPVR